MERLIFIGAKKRKNEWSFNLPISYVRNGWSIPLVVHHYFEGKTGACNQPEPFETSLISAAALDGRKDTTTISRLEDHHLATVTACKSPSLSLAANTSMPVFSPEASSKIFCSRLSFLVLRERMEGTGFIGFIFSFFFAGLAVDFCLLPGKLRLSPTLVRPSTKANSRHPSSKPKPWTLPAAAVLCDLLLHCRLPAMNEPC